MAFIVLLGLMGTTVVLGLLDHFRSEQHQRQVEAAAAAEEGTITIRTCAWSRGLQIRRNH